MDEPGYVYGIWFVPSGDATKDWLGTLYKADRDGRWYFTYRFRYYNPESKNPHDGLDEKSHYGWQGPDGEDATRDHMIRALKTLIPAIEWQFGARHYFIKLECRNDEPKFFFELANQPWAHVKIGVRDPSEPLPGGDAACSD